MQSKIKLTISVPVYNQSRWIEKTLNSIYKNKPDQAVVYVHDDGSSDGSTEIAENLCKQYGFNFSKSENRGLTRTLNYLLRISDDSAYFFVVGGDDILTAGGLSEAIKLLDENPDCGGVYGRVLMIDANDNVFKEIRNSRASGYLYKDLALCKITAPVNFVVWRRRDIIEVGGYDERFKLEDIVMFRKISKIRPILYVDKVLLHYRKVGDSTSANPDMLEEQFHKVNMLLIDEPFFHEFMLIQNAQLYLNLANKRKLRSLKYLFKTDPFSLVRFKLICHGTLVLLFKW